jgi:hypothetical protein
LCGADRRKQRELEQKEAKETKGIQDWAGIGIGSSDELPRGVGSCGADRRKQRELEQKEAKETKGIQGWAGTGIGSSDELPRGLGTLRSPTEGNKENLNRRKQR